MLVQSQFLQVTWLSSSHLAHWRCLVLVSFQKFESRGFELTCDSDRISKFITWIPPTVPRTRWSQARHASTYETIKSFYLIVSSKTYNYQVMGSPKTEKSKSGHELVDFIIVSIVMVPILHKRVTFVPAPLKWPPQDSLGAFPFPVWKNWREGIHITAQRKEHCKTEFGKKNFEKKFGESETFYQSKFSPATGVIISFRSFLGFEDPT